MSKPTLDQASRMMIEGFSVWCYRQGLVKGPQDIETVRRHWNNFQRCVHEIAQAEGVNLPPAIIEVDRAGPGEHVH